MYKKIIVPVDVSNAEKAEAMLATARKLGDDSSVIVLMNVVEAIPGYIAAQIPGNYEEEGKAYSRGELERIAKAAGIPAEIEVRVGHASQGILDVADEKGADAIVIASHRPGLSDYFLGSTAARVVRYAPCTVVVLRG
jgi:universal stress protein F